MDPRADSAYYLERYAYGTLHVWSMIRAYGRDIAASCIMRHPPEDGNSEGYKDAIDHAFGR